MKKILLMGLPMLRYQQPMLGLGYIGAALKKSGHEVKIIDATHPASGDLFKLEKEIREFSPDYVGVSALTAQMNDAARVFALVKKIDSKIITLAGGPHVSALPEETSASYPELDNVFIGEGEVSLPKFVDHKEKGLPISAVEGLAWREKDGIHFTRPVFIENISSLAMPWSVIDPHSYNQREVHGYTCKHRPIVSVLSSRGCPFQCIFCAQKAVFGSSIRVREASEFVNELEYLHRDCGIREFHFADDNFTFYPEHAERVCNEILKRKLNFSWALINGVRADKLNESLLKLMKKAGCYYMAFGLESGSPNTLKRYKKSLDVKKSYENVCTASRLGFITQGFFLIAAPFETVEDLDMSLKLIKKLPLDRVAVGIPIPFPGSELFEYYKKNVFKDGKTPDWDYFSWGNFKPYWEHLNGDIAAAKVKEAFLSVYMDPVRMFRFALKLRTWEQYATTLAGFRQWIVHVFGKIKDIK